MTKTKVFALLFLSGFIMVSLSSCVCYVRPPRPASRSEVVSPRPPARRAKWISGHWKWNRRTKTWGWIPGHWRRR